MFEGKASRPRWWSRPAGAGAPGAGFHAGSGGGPAPSGPLPADVPPADPPPSAGPVGGPGPSGVRHGGAGDAPPAGAQGATTLVGSPRPGDTPGTDAPRTDAPGTDPPSAGPPGGPAPGSGPGARTLPGSVTGEEARLRSPETMRLSAVPPEAVPPDAAPAQAAPGRTVPAQAAGQEPGGPGPVSFVKRAAAPTAAAPTAGHPAAGRAATAPAGDAGTGDDTGGGTGGGTDRDSGGDRGAAPGGTLAAPVEPDPFAPPADATAPQYRPDPYGTPPYGRPGPYAPAPPVQHPNQARHPDRARHPGPPPHPFPAPGPQPHPQVPGQLQQPAPWHRPQPWGGPGGPPAHHQHPAPPPPRKRRTGRLVVGALLIALVAGVSGGAAGALLGESGEPGVRLPQAPADGSHDRAPDSVAGIAAATLPGVVYIHVRGTGDRGSGTGTGFVLDGKGHLLTNNHVVEAAADGGQITVTFNSGEVRPAEIVGGDGGYDLAVLKVEGASGLHPLKLGNSDSVEVGDPVVAIGAPYDLEGTVTSGIISAKDRPIMVGGGGGGSGTDVSYVNALQTDAPINPGNSGGPLVNSRGEVVGINSLIRAAGGGPFGGDVQGGSIGLGFAIPMNQAKRVAEELINTGEATHPVIGVRVDMRFTGDGAKISERSEDGGEPVTPGGPADDAGIKPGDVVTAVDGKAVRSGEELIVKIRSRMPGETMHLTVERGGKERRAAVTLGSASGD